MKNKLINLGIVFALLLTLVTPILAKTSTTTLTIHKLKYDTDLLTDKKITNDGTEKTYDASIVPYNADEYGEIGFTLYRLNSEKTIAKLKEENGNSQSLADKIATDIGGNTTSGLITKIEVSEVKQTNGTNPITMTVNTTASKGEYFLLVETTSPKTVVAKAQPMLLQFPIRSTDGKSYLDTVHLYPKNKVDESTRELEFNKVVLKVAQDGTVDSTTKFEGADFEIYKGKPGSGEKLMKDGNAVKLTSNAQGTFKITGLTVGNYYLVEVASDKVDSLVSTETKSTEKNFVASIDAKNDENNKYAFRMDEDGYIYKITGWNGDTATTSKGTEYNADNEKLPSIKNTVKPSISKKLTSKADSLGYSDVLEYEIDVNIPANFGENSADEKIVINDKITEDIIINKDSFRVYDKEGNERTNAKLTVVKVKDNEVNIVVDKETIKTDGNNVSYKPIVIKYTVKLSKDFSINGEVEIKNNIASKYTIDGNEFNDPENPVNPENPNEPTPDKNREVTVKTYTKKLKKLDSGLFDQGAMKQPINGAEFILGRKIGEKVEYRKTDAIDKYTWTETKSDAQTIKSGDDGTFEFEGLAAKTDAGAEITYFAEEVKAPENYTLPKEIKDRQHEFNFTGENNVLEILNNKSVDAPMTGREKAVITAGGLLLALIVSGAFLIVSKRKKQRA